MKSMANMTHRTLSIPLFAITLALGACSDDGSDTTDSGATDPTNST